MLALGGQRSASFWSASDKVLLSLHNCLRSLGSKVLSEDKENKTYDFSRCNSSTIRSTMDNQV